MSFPLPTDEAIEAGLISEDELGPNAIRGIHEEHARQILAAIREHDTILHASRLGIDPTTGRQPKSHSARERLQKRFATEPGRLDRWRMTRIDSYEQMFGAQAADAFSKAIRAWHAGIEVVADGGTPSVESDATAQPGAARFSSLLPVPKPLRSSVVAGIFRYEENGKPIRYWIGSGRSGFL